MAGLDTLGLTADVALKFAHEPEDNGSEHLDHQLRVWRYATQGGIRMLAILHGRADQMSILVAAMMAAEILAPPPQAVEVVSNVTGEDVAALWKEATGQDVTIKVHEQAVEIEVPIAAPNRARIWLNNCSTDVPKVCSRITFDWMFELGNYEKAGEMAGTFSSRRYLNVRRGGGQVVATRLENLPGGVTRENLRATFRRVAAEMTCGENLARVHVNRTEPMYSGPPVITSEPYRDRCAGE